MSQKNPLGGSGPIKWFQAAMVPGCDEKRQGPGGSEIDKGQHFSYEGGEKGPVESQKEDHYAHGDQVHPNFEYPCHGPSEFCGRGDYL